MPDWIVNPGWFGTIVWALIYFALTVDGLRAVIAMLGIVPRNSKWLSRFIYGRYDRVVLYEALKDLGYPQRDAEVLIANLQKSVPVGQSSGVNKENVTEQVLAVLANYVQKYPRNIQYGGTTLSDSTYYIDTMEAVHDGNMLTVMTDAMVTLISERLGGKKPDIIFAPKGGNPILAKAVAESFSAKLVVVKPKKHDKSRANLGGSLTPEEELLLFRSNYEGSWTVATHEGEGQIGIVIDCNASGGSQLREIACDLNRLIDKLAGTKCELNIEKITDVFVLFRADTKHQNVDQKFRDLGLSIHRFFDLQEADKEALSQLHDMHSDETPVSVYSAADQPMISSILESLAKEDNLYWQTKELCPK